MAVSSKSVSLFQNLPMGRIRSPLQDSWCILVRHPLRRSIIWVESKRMSEHQQLSCIPVRSRTWHAMCFIGGKNDLETGWPRRLKHGRVRLGRPVVHPGEWDYDTALSPRLHPPDPKPRAYRPAPSVGPVSRLRSAQVDLLSDVAASQKLRRTGRTEGASRD